MRNQTYRKTLQAVKLLLFILAVFPGGLLAREIGDFSDLYEEDRRFYGSEREKKFPVSALVVEKEKWKDHEAWSVFWIYGWKEYPRYRSSRFLPFYYHVESKLENDNREKTFLLPFYYHRRDGASKLIVTPVGMHSSNEMENFNLFGWFFLRWDYDTRTHTALLPFFYTGTDSWDKSRYVGVFPLFYLRWGEAGRRFNFVGLVDITTDKYGLESLWVLPLLYYGRSSSDPHQGNKEFARFSAHHSSYFHFFPVFFSGSHTHSSESGEEIGYDKWMYALLFYHSKYRDFCNPTDTATKTWIANVYFTTHHTENEKVTRDGHGGVIFPLVAWSREKTKWTGDEKRSGSEFNFYTLLFGYSSSDEPTPSEKYPDGRTSEWSVWFPIVPLFKTGGRSTPELEESSLLALPLFYRKSRTEDLGKAGIGKNFGLFTLLFGYRSETGPSSTNPDRDDSVTFWAPILPLFYYKHTGSGDTRSILTVSPFHYYKRDETSMRLWALLYYHSLVPESPLATPKGETPFTEEVRHVLPLFYSWKTREETGQVFLPFYLSYEDKNTYFHANILGLSFWRNRGGINTDVSVDRNEAGGVVLDWEFAWLYNMFRLSSRLTLGAAENRPDLPKTVDGKKGETAALKKRPGRTREDSQNFFGVSLFYGIFAYERADTRRHIRLLPLSWLTWDTESDDKVYFIPPVFWYQSDDLEYFVIFPVYGKQRQGESFIQSFGIFLFLREYDAETKTREFSVLWPFVNVYDSPAKSGGRILPFAWWRTERAGDTESGFVLTPLFYYSHEKSGTAGDSMSISWLSYYHREWNNESETTTMFAPLLPIYSQGKTKTGKSESFWSMLLPIYYFSTSKVVSTDTRWVGKGNATAETYETTYYERNIFAFPLLTWINTSRREEDGKSTPGNTTVASFAFVYHDNPSANTTTVWAPILPILFYHSRGTDSTHTNVLWLFDFKTQSGRLDRVWAPFGVVMWERNNYLWAFPFYYSSDETSTTFHVVPIFWSHFQKGASPEDNEYTMFIAGLYLHGSKNYSRQNFLYLYDRIWTPNTHSVSFLFSAINYESNPQTTRGSMLYRLLLGWEYQDSRNYNFNVLWYVQKREQDHFVSTFLPLWWYSSSSTHNTLFLPLLFTYISYDGADKFEVIGGGLLWYRNYDSYRRTNTEHALLGTLYLGIDRPERGYKSRGSMWGFLWESQRETDTDYRKFSILKGIAFSRTTSGGRTWTRILGIRFGDDPHQESDSDDGSMVDPKLEEQDHRGSAAVELDFPSEPSVEREFPVRGEFAAVGAEERILTGAVR